MESGKGISQRFWNRIVSALDSEDEVGRTDLDSHADSPVVGMNAKILSYTGKHVNVWGFTKALGSRSKIPVVNASVVPLIAI